MNAEGWTTNAMVAAFIRTAGEPPYGLDPIRAGLAAALQQHKTEVRDASAMTRDERIAERTRDLLDEVTSVELYPASVGEVADEIARYVLELDASGAARGLASEVVARLALRPVPGKLIECRQGEHRDMNVVATHRIAYVGPRGGDQQWTTDVCVRHAKTIRARLIRQGNRNVRLVPAGWTPQDDCTHGADCEVHPGTGQVHNLDDLPIFDPGALGAGKSADPLPGAWEASDLFGGEADGFHRP